MKDGGIVARRNAFGGAGSFKRIFQARAWRQLAVFITLLAGMACGMAQAAETDDAHVAFDARVAGDETRTRVVVDFVGQPEFAVHYLADPVRVIVDLPQTLFAFEDEALEPRGLFDDIRFGAMGPNKSRIVLSANGPVELEIAEVEKREEGEGYRLVLDAVTASETRFAELVEGQQWRAVTDEATGDKVVESRRADPFTVVIDPGHGGIDNGAQGVKGTREKDVTLAFSKAIAEALSKYDGIEVVLTREDDRFISLGGRVRIAREHNADVMMSVHADSIRYPDIRGATVYTVSDKASDRMAADLARRENKSDEAAGVEATPTNEVVADILMDLTRRETQVFSIGLARSVLDEFKGEIRLINNAHRYAGFRVLGAPDVPSLLVELGYLSNVEDEKLLNDPEWREKTAGLLAAALDGFRERILTAAKDM